MRRLTAALSFLALANFAIVQALSACPQDQPAARESATSAHSVDHSEHAGHSMVPVGKETGQTEQGTSPTHEPGCLTMGQCALSIDVTLAVAVRTFDQHVSRPVGASETQPDSRDSSPELPPPRA